MHHPKSFRARLVVFASIFILALGAPDLTRAAAWQSANIGSATGSDSIANGVMTVSGSGQGLDYRGDQAHFVYQTIFTGNFRLTVRLTGFTGGGANACAGLLLRSGLDPKASNAAIMYRPQGGNSAAPHIFQMYSNDLDPHSHYGGKSGQYNFKMGPPCYLQLIRWGKDFAVYISDNGRFWAPVSSTSGSAFETPGPVKVGLFVCSGGTDTATATFDHVKLDTTPTLPYRTSWIGNTGADDDTSYTSGGMNGMYVAPDGTCYCISGWDEGGERGKVYQDGQVVGGLPNPNGGGENGVVTDADGKHVFYYFGVSDDSNGLYRINTHGGYLDADPPRLMLLESPLIDPRNGTNLMAGLAFANNELYVSDALTNKILVVDPSAPVYCDQRTAGRVSATIDTSAVTNPAPQEVYQSSIQSSGIGVAVPGVKPGASYKVRFHFAETDPAANAPGKRVMNLSAGAEGSPATPAETVNNYDIFKTAGALDKATVVEIDNVVANSSGKLDVNASRVQGGNAKYALLCGVEVLNSDGSPFLAINCGGGEVGSWKSSVHELTSRDFSVPKAGPIAADKAGQIWVLGEARDYPASGQFTYTPHTASLRLYDKNGKFLNKQITGLDNPDALGYDATRDRLLVCENGPAQNIRIYDVFTGTDKAPALESTFGYPGGIFAGPTPGLVHDDKAGGDARFCGPTGVGTDTAGNIYVLLNPSNIQNQLMSFKPDGTLNWRLFCLEFCNCGDFDPEHPGDLWTTTKHYKMNWNTTVPGAEWKLHAYTINPASSIKYPGFLGAANSVLVKLHGKNYLFSGGQGFMGDVNIWRYSGELAIPCGQISPKRDGTQLWIDANGDGNQQPGEITKFPNIGIGDPRNYSFDQQGNIYLYLDNIPAPHVERIDFKGLNAIGAPIYDVAHAKQQPLPAPMEKGLGVRGRAVYGGGPSDTMFLMAQAHLNPTDGNLGGIVGCYDHWNTKPVQRYVTALPDPATYPLFDIGQPPFGGDGFDYMAMDVANGYAFCSTLFDHIFVLDPHGHIVQLITPGPEVSGQGAWDDEAMGLRVHYVPSLGEYVILQEASGWRGRENMYRIKSLPTADAPGY